MNDAVYELFEQIITRLNVDHETKSKVIDAAVDQLLWCKKLENKKKETPLEVFEVEIPTQADEAWLVMCEDCCHIHQVFHLDWYAVICTECGEKVVQQDSFVKHVRLNGEIPF